MLVGRKVFAKMDGQDMKERHARFRYYGERIAKAIKHSISEFDVAENTPEENEMFMNTVKTKTPTIIEGSFLRGTITSRARARKDRYYAFA